MAIDAKKLGKTAGKFARFRAALSRLSNSAWLAVGTFAALLLLTGVVWLLAWRNPLWVPWQIYLTPARGGLLLGLAVLACTSEYFLFRIWFDESPLPDRDLRQGWTASINHFQTSEIDITERPCFLLLDPAGIAEKWFDSAGVRVRSHDAVINSPVQWFEAEESLFLVVRGLGGLGPLVSELSSLRRRATQLRREAHQPASVDSRTESRARQQVAVTQSLDDGWDVVGEAASPNDGVSELQNEPSDNSSFDGIDVDDVRDALLDDLPDEVANDRPSDSSNADVDHARISSIEVSRQTGRLAEVCRRLASVRRPVVPANGVCVLVPEPVLASIHGSGKRLGHALKHDLALLQDELGVAAPVSLLLTDVEDDAGFTELIRRGGPDAARSESLGVVHSPLRATADVVNRMGEEFESRIQQRVGRRFRDDRAVGRPGASRLFQLMASLRGQRGLEWRQFVSTALNKTDRDSPELFAGLLVAATGDEPSKRAYGRAVYRQLLANQEFVEWTPKSRSSERLQSALAYVFGVLAVVAFVSLVALSFGWM